MHGNMLINCCRVFFHGGQLDHCCIQIIKDVYEFRNMELLSRRTRTLLIPTGINRAENEVMRYNCESYLVVVIITRTLTAQ